MKIEVRYQSRGGNTKAVAETIADAAGVSAKSIDHALEEYTDVLFLGGGVYAWKMDKSMAAFLSSLDGAKVGKIVAFSTTGASDSVNKKILAAAKGAGIEVCDKAFCLKLGAQGNTLLGKKGGALKDEQIERARAFTKDVLADLG